MTNTNPGPKRKRARLFGRDPFPGFFSLDTSNNELPSGFFQQALASCASDAGDKGRATSPAGVAKPTSFDRNGSTPGNDDRDDLRSSPTPTRTPSATPSATPPTARTAPPAATAEPSTVASPAPTDDIVSSPIVAAAVGGDTESVVSVVSVETTAAVAAAAAAATTAATPAPAASAVEPCKVESPAPTNGIFGSPITAAAGRRDATPAASVVPTRNAPSDRRATGVHGSASDLTATSGAPPPPAVSDGKCIPMEEDAAAVAPAPGNSSGRAGVAGGGATAASVVASFLKRGSTVPLQPGGGAAMSPAGVSSVSPPTTKTPTPLASLITGIPPGSGGSSGEWRREEDSSAPNRGAPVAAGAGNRIQSPRRGGNRYFHNEWPRILKKRRRILHYPKPSEPDGSRVLYWVRGNYRVKDNLSLSVALWLSTELQLPLQAVTFVDPAIGRSAPLSPGAGGAQRDAARQEVAFRTMVEASALCEMEGALRALNVPLVAISCVDGEIPSALACWCRGSHGGGAAENSSESATAVTGATTKRSPMEGSAHITIMDECYHPTQLSLSEKARDALRGTGALYAVDSSCVCPVNTSGGGGARAGVCAATDGVTGVLSPEEFRQTQDGCLPTVLADLTIRPRLPLKTQLQNQMFVGGGERAMLPREFQLGAGATASSAIAVDWDKLREISARRFPGFGKPIPSELASSDKDLISIFGGGERVGEMALRQTVHLAGASTPDGQRSAGTGVTLSSHTDDNGRLPPPQEICARLENETAGLGFGGSLLHFIRLGSVSSLSVVQARIHRRLAALFERVHCSGAGGKRVEDLASKLGEPRRRLLDEVLRREYTLYRARFYHRGLGRAPHPSAVPGATTPGVSAAAKGHEGRGKDSWMGIVPAWVWEELRKGQLDARKKQHNPEEMRLAGSTEPSSVHDRVFSAIQARLTTRARLHPSLAPYWARAVVKMMLVPSQAISLIVHLAEEFCLGAAHAGDVVPDLLDSAFGVLREPPPRSTITSGGPPAVAARASSPGRAVAETRRETSVFRRLYHPPLATEEGLRSAFGGEEALARFLTAKVPPPPPTIYSPLGTLA
ncbi:unnamed protein product [Ectocarpus sp. 4 AP-2014]